MPHFFLFLTSFFEVHYICYQIMHFDKTFHGYVSMLNIQTTFFYHPLHHRFRLAYVYTLYKVAFIAKKTYYKARGHFHLNLIVHF
jgi:hypothetical protein